VDLSTSDADITPPSDGTAVSPADEQTQTAITDVLESAREEHGFKSATVYFYDRDSGTLAPVVATGPQSAFISQIPPLRFDADSEIAQVMRMGRAIFVGDTHDAVIEQAESPDGVGRWRSGIETGSHATLPLADHTGNVGVVSLEWGDARPFKRPDRDAIYRIARAVVTAVRRTSRAQLPSGDRAPVRVLGNEQLAPLVVEAHPPTTVERLLVLDAEGELIDESIARGRPWLASVALLEAPAARSTPRAGALLDVHRTANGRLAVVVGSSLPGEIAEESARLVGHALRVHSLFAESAADLAGRLRETLTAAGAPGATALGVVFLDATTGELDVAGSDSTPCVLVRREGGARSLTAGSTALVLPGDHIVLATGCPRAVDDGAPGCGQCIAETFETLGVVAAAEVPRRLLAQAERWAPSGDTDVAIACITRYAG